MWTYVRAIPLAARYFRYRPVADILKAALSRPRAQCARLVRSSVVGVGDEASALTKSQRAYRRSFETLEEMQRFVVGIDSPFFPQLGLLYRRRIQA